MRAPERDLLALRWLAAMPFLDRLELAAVAGMYEEASHLALSSLRRAGLAEFVSHAAPHIPSSRRWRLTGQGMRHLAVEDGIGVDRLLRTRPVSARWQRLLLARLDGVASSTGWRRRWRTRRGRRGSGGTAARPWTPP